MVAASSIREGIDFKMVPVSMSADIVKAADMGVLGHAKPGCGAGSGVRKGGEREGGAFTTIKKNRHSYSSENMEV